MTGRATRADEVEAIVRLLAAGVTRKLIWGLTIGRIASQIRRFLKMSGIRPAYCAFC
jgi:hypothetical protein